MRFKVAFILSLLAFFVAGCSSDSRNWSELEVTNLSGKSIDMAKLSHPSAVFFFLSPECPLCQNYSVKMGELIDQHQNDSLKFIGVFSGAFYSVPEIKKYLRKYQLMELTPILDPDLSLANGLGATITPEAVLTEKREILYRGAIDDWAIDLGHKRLKVNRDYLHDAIEALQNNRKIDPSRTAAVGCFIE